MMKKYFKLSMVCGVWSLFFSLNTQVYAQAKLADVKSDLKKSSEKLNSQRAEVSAERVALSSKLTQTQNELVSKRRQARLARMSDADRKESMRQLEEKAAAQAGEQQFLSNQIGSFAGKLAATAVKGEKLDLGDASTLELRMQAIETGLARLEKVVGGTVIDADGVDSDGAVKSGKLAMLGPAMWFKASDGSFIGEVTLSKGGRLATVTSNDEEVSQIFAGKELMASIDVTGGKARALANINQSPLDLLRKGGIWVWPIIGVALIALVCAFLKFMQLAKIKNPETGWLSGVLDDLRSGNVEAAIDASKGVNHPVGEVISESLTGYDKGADMVEDMIYERMIGVQEKLRKWLPFIAVTAAIAPLLGLLGTVSGMIGTFNVISVAGTGDPKPMAGGISEALVTTFFGLVVAIPALILHSMLSRRSQGIVQTTEKLGLRIVNSIRKNSE